MRKKVEIEKLINEYVRTAQTARKVHELPSFFILMDKVNLLEWVLGEREKP